MKSVFLLLVIVALILCFKCIPQITTNKESQEKCKLCVGIGIFLVVVYICTNDTIEGITDEEADVIPPVDEEADVDPADVMPPVDGDADVVPPVDNKNLTTNASDCPSNCNETLPCWQKPATVCGTVGAGSETGENDCTVAGGVWCGDDKPDPGPEPEPGPEPGPEPPLPVTGNTYIQFTNATDKTMFIYFDRDPNANNADRIFSPPVKKPQNNVNSTYWMVEVLIGGSLNISTNTGNINDWLSGECCITDKESYAGNSGNMNHAGLTSFEWTIDTKTVSANISNVSGANVNGTMTITGLQCDKNTSTNNMDLSQGGCQNDFKFMTGGNGDITTCSIKKQDNIQAVPRDGLVCGDKTECLGCDLDGEQCDWTTDSYWTGGCYASTLMKHYGCLEWWTTNDKAQLWANYNKANGSDAYYWGMGEQILGKNKYDSTVKYDGTPLSEGSKALQCVSGKAKNEQGPKWEDYCSGYIINNPEGSLRSCTRPDESTKFMINFTIKEIMHTP